MKERSPVDSVQGEDLQALVAAEAPMALPSFGKNQILFSLFHVDHHHNPFLIPQEDGSVCAPADLELCNHLFAVADSSSQCPLAATELMKHSAVH